MVWRAANVGDGCCGWRRPARRQQSAANNGVGSANRDVIAPLWLHPINVESCFLRLSAFCLHVVAASCFPIPRLSACISHRVPCLSRRSTLALLLESHTPASLRAAHDADCKQSIEIATSSSSQGGSEPCTGSFSGPFVRLRCPDKSDGIAVSPSRKAR